MKTSARWEEGRENEREGEGRGRNPATKCGTRVVTLGLLWPLTIVFMIKGRRPLRHSLWLHKTIPELDVDHMGIFIHAYTHLLFCLAFFAPLALSFSHLYVTTFEPGGMKVRDFHWVISPQVSLALPARLLCIFLWKEHRFTLYQNPSWRLYQMR